MTQMTFARAINSGLRKSLENDPKVILMGEDIGTLGGVFRVTDGLQKDFGKHRVVDTPLAESGIIGTAVGLAYRGYRPVVEIQFDGFIYPAFDQIVSQVAKMHYRTQGAVKMPITIRVPFGGGIGSPGTPLRITRGLLHPHLRPARGQRLQPAGRLHDDPAGHRLRRSGALLRTQAPLPRQGRGG